MPLGVLKCIRPHEHWGPNIPQKMGIVSNFENGSMVLKGFTRYMLPINDGS